MNKETCLLIIFGLMVSLSIITVISLINRPQSQNDSTSQLRFKFLIAIHLIVFAYVVVILNLRQIYFIILTTFATFLIIALSCFICENHAVQIQQMDNYNYNHAGSSMEPIELTYLDMYFMVYMYSIIGLLPAIIFLVTTEVLICTHECHYNKQKAKYLRKTGYCQQFKDKECSICLVQFDEQDKNNLLHIYACRHTFHQKCLGEWLEYNDICPLDRKKIFQANQQPLQLNQE